jgi:homoserine dehydrogenase
MSKPASGTAISKAARRSSRRSVRLGLIGVGTVGQGTIRVLAEHQRELERRLGCRVELKKICSRSIHQKDISWIGHPVETTTDWKQVVGDPGVDIVVELVGEPKTALAIARAALKERKHLVTANKQLVAEHGLELVELGRAAGVSLGIEACVAGGMPILHAIREGLSGEHFRAVFGILNGTTNYILTEMERRNCSFAEALAEAQAHGYAEPDPTMDVEGYDARYKIAILAMISFGQAVEVRDIPVEGITRIGPIDFAYAHVLRRTIRLIAAARRTSGGRLEAFVRPMMIPADGPFAGIHGATNGVLLVGNKGGNTLITGRGAGGEPTGVAVLSDVVEIAREMVRGGAALAPRPDRRSPQAGASVLGYTHWHRAKLAPAGETVASTYLRLIVRDQPGILARVSGILARHGINIDSVLQEPNHPKRRLPFVMTLEPGPDKQVSRAVSEISRLRFLAEAPLTMPLAEMP